VRVMDYGTAANVSSECCACRRCPVAASRAAHFGPETGPDQSFAAVSQSPLPVQSFRERRFDLCENPASLFFCVRLRIGVTHFDLAEIG